jgi:hypothetical protein
LVRDACAQAERLAGWARRCDVNRGIDDRGVNVDQCVRDIQSGVGDVDGSVGGVTRCIGAIVRCIGDVDSGVGHVIGCVRRVVPGVGAVRSGVGHIVRRVGCVVSRVDDQGVRAVRRARLGLDEIGLTAFRVVAERGFRARYQDIRGRVVASIVVVNV